MSVTPAVWAASVGLFDPVVFFLTWIIWRVELVGIRLLKGKKRFRKKLKSFRVYLTAVFDYCKR